MRYHEITINHNRAGLVEKITAMLTQIGITTISGKSIHENGYIMKFSDRLNPIQSRIIHLFLRDNRLFSSDFEFTEIPETFNFEDFQFTDINGATQEAQIDECIVDVEGIIGNILADRTTEFRKQAREEVAELWKDKINQWVEFTA